MNNLLNFLFIILLMLFPLSGKAQQLSLQDCFEIGAKNYSDFKIQALKIEQSQKAKRSIASSFLPQIGISASHSYNFGSSINPSNNNREPSNIQSDNLSIDFRANLIDFSKWSENNIQNYDIEIEKWNYKIIEIQFQMLILEKYMKALTLQEWKKSMKSQVDNSNQTLKRILDEVEQGKRPKSDAYDIQVIYLQETNDFEKIKTDEHVAKLELLQLINSESFQANQIVMSFPEAVFYQHENYKVNQNPSLQKTNASLLKNQAEQKQLQKVYLPTLDFVYSYGTFYAQKINNLSDTNFQFQNQLKDNKSQFVGLSLYIPVFSKGSNSQKSRLKELEYTILKEEEIKETKRLSDNLEIAKTKISFLSEEQNRLIAIEEISEKALETTASKYVFDKADATNYKLAKNQLLQSQYNLLSNKIQFFSEIYQLELQFK